MNLRKKKQKSSATSECDYDLVPNKEIRTHVKKVVPTKPTSVLSNKIRAKPQVSPVKNKFSGTTPLKKNSVP